jgi:hypothetical protein
MMLQLAGFTVAGWRQANGNALNQAEYAVGSTEDTYVADLVVRVSNTNTGAATQSGLGDNTLAGPSGTVSTISTPSELAILLFIRVPIATSLRLALTISHG